MCAALLLVFAPLAYAREDAPAPAESACDPEYYDSLESRAWMEAQREITQNQNLIFKPDSVLEYTCFDQYLNVVAGQAKEMFSESQRWGAVEGIDDTSMDTALNNLVGGTMSTYINANFENPGYNLLGGRSEDLNHEPQPIDGGEYNCEIMNQVWMQAKCMSFLNNPEKDGFFTFAAYQAGDDMRFLPTQCEAIAELWETEIQNASFDEQTAWMEDPVASYHDVILDPAAKCESAPAIPTGLKVSPRDQNPQEYDEKICISPGCYYDAAEGSCKLSVQ